MPFFFFDLFGQCANFHNPSQEMNFFEWSHFPSFLCFSLLYFNIRAEIPFDGTKVVQLAFYVYTPGS